jgi:hypothetical protein
VFNRHLIFSGLLSLASSIALAQNVPSVSFTAPPDVEKELRARVAEFFQLHVEGNFRKAHSMVADYDKDFYVAARKRTILLFKINRIRFRTSDFTQASVDVDTGEKIRRGESAVEVVLVPGTTLWRIERGEWVWYRGRPSEF